MVEPLYAWPHSWASEQQAQDLAELLQRSFNQSGTIIEPEAVLSAARHALQSGQVEIISRQVAITQNKASETVPGRPSLQRFAGPFSSLFV